MEPCQTEGLPQVLLVNSDRSRKDVTDSLVLPRKSSVNRERERVRSLTEILETMKIISKARTRVSLCDQFFF